MRGNSSTGELLDGHILSMANPFKPHNLTGSVYSYLYVLWCMGLYTVEDLKLCSHTLMCLQINMVAHTEFPMNSSSVVALSVPLSEVIRWLPHSLLLTSRIQTIKNTYRTVVTNIVFYGFSSNSFGHPLFQIYCGDDGHSQRQKVPG